LWASFLKWYYTPKINKKFPHVVSNIEILKNVGIQTTLEPIDFNYMRFLKISYFMCWVIFGWTLTLSSINISLLQCICVLVWSVHVCSHYTRLFWAFTYSQNTEYKCVCIFSPCQSPGSFWHFLGQICPSKVWGDAGKFLIEEWILVLYRYIPFHPHLQRNPETHTTFQSQFVCDTVCIHCWHY